MNTERTFNALELKCFPSGCLIPNNQQPILATVLVPQLEVAGMQTAEWTRGALMLEEPHFTFVKGIVCRSCHISECQYNPHFRPSDGLKELMEGQYADRIKKGDDLLAKIIPNAKKAELKQAGIEFVALQMPSRKNPQLVFSFSRDGISRRVCCEVGRRRLFSADEGEETLHSLDHMTLRVNRAIDQVANPLFY